MSEQKKYFDISTSEARIKTIQQLGLMGLIAQLGLIHYQLFRWFGWLSSSVDKEIESQRKTAIEIIRAGKDHSVDELEITMSEKAGLSLGANVEGFPIECTVGTSERMTIKIKYK